jgi:UDP-GlcNAc:undecaprenyl-phosphate GlcNAc-1-phosphate transferase
MVLSRLHLLLVGLALLLALVLTPVVRALAWRWGLIDPPKHERWHTRPTALLGGIAIALAVTLSCLSFALSRIAKDAGGMTAFVQLVLGFSIGLLSWWLLTDDDQPDRPQPGRHCAV